jgi:hypothetical protein
LGRAGLHRKQQEILRARRDPKKQQEYFKEVRRAVIDQPVDPTNQSKASEWQRLAVVVILMSCKTKQKNDRTNELPPFRA